MASGFARVFSLARVFWRFHVEHAEDGGRDERQENAQKQQASHTFERSHDRAIPLQGPELLR